MTSPCSGLLRAIFSGLATISPTLYTFVCIVMNIKSEILAFFFPTLDQRRMLMSTTSEHPWILIKLILSSDIQSMLYTCATLTLAPWRNTNKQTSYARLVRCCLSCSARRTRTYVHLLYICRAATTVCLLSFRMHSGVAHRRQDDEPHSMSRNYN